jgi:hypothetical protein
MPIHIKEEEKTASRLNRNHSVPYIVAFLDITPDKDAEKLEVKLHHPGAFPHVLAQLEIHFQKEQAPLDFKYVVEESKAKITFYADNEYALNFLLKIGAISKITYTDATFWHRLESSQPSTPLQYLRR